MTGYQLGTPAYRRVTAALFLAGLATFALLYAAQPLLPTLAAEFGVTPGSSALAVSATTLGLGLALLVAGPASEVWGRTPLMYASLFGAGAVGLACALAPSWPLLLLARTVQGVVLAGLPAVATAYLAEEMAPRARAAAAGIYIGGTALGGMSGRLLTGLLAEAFGWRGGLAGIALLALACAVAVRVLLPPSRHFRPAPAGWTNLRRATKAILVDPAMLCLFGIAGTSMGAFVGVFNAVGFRLESPEFGLSVGLAGLVFGSYAFGSLSSAYAGALVERTSERAVAPWCAAVALVGVVITLGGSLWLVVAGLAVLCVGFFALHGVASGWVAARATLGAGAPGQASSGYLFSYYLGSSIFGTLAGAAWSSGGWGWVVAMCAALFGVSLVLTLVLRRIPSLDEKDHPLPPPAGV